MGTRAFIYSLLFYAVIFWSCSEIESTKNAPSTSLGKPTVTLSDTTRLAAPTPEKIEKPIPFIVDYDTTLWADLTQVDPNLTLDLRYATKDNFVEEQMYDCPRCFLRPEAAKALKLVHESLNKKGYQLKLFDCYRPKSVQEKLWAKVPNATYVTPPHKGSMHNRGYAVDVTLLDKSDKELDMGSEFDFFGRQAHHDFYELDQGVLDRRKLLRETMAAFGFRHIRTEWWHYSYRGPYKSPFILADFQWSCH